MQTSTITIVNDEMQSYENIVHILENVGASTKASTKAKHVPSKHVESSTNVVTKEDYAVKDKLSKFKGP